MNDYRNGTLEFCRYAIERARFWRLAGYPGDAAMWLSFAATHRMILVGAR